MVLSFLKFNKISMQIFFFLNLCSSQNILNKIWQKGGEEKVVY